MKWKNYISYTPSAGKISKLFGEEVVNDHIAFRTLDLKQKSKHTQTKLTICSSLAIKSLVTIILSKKN